MLVLYFWLRLTVFYSGDGNVLSVVSISPHAHRILLQLGSGPNSSGLHAHRLRALGLTSFWLAHLTIGGFGFVDQRRYVFGIKVSQQ